MSASLDPEKYDPALLANAKEASRLLLEGARELLFILRGDYAKVFRTKQSCYYYAKALKAAGRTEDARILSRLVLRLRRYEDGTADVVASFAIMAEALALADQHIMREAEASARRLEGREPDKPLVTQLKERAVDEMARKQNEAMEALLRGEALKQDTEIKPPSEWLLGPEEKK